MTDWPRIPDGVVESVAKRWPERALRWAELVEAELREVCDMYDATPRNVLPARYGFVVAADSPRGGLVLRSSPDPDAWEQADVAYAMAALFVGPVVHETVASIAGLWTVMDEVRPGTPLALVDRETVDIRALAGLFATMRDQPAPRVDMPTIYDWLQRRLEDDNLSDIPVWRDGPAPINERIDALILLDRLAQDSKLQLCHGDASTWNLLACSDGGWKAVDPRGMSGEVEYDLAVVALKLRGSLSSGRAAELLCQYAAVSSERVIAWMKVADAARV